MTFNEQLLRRPIRLLKGGETVTVTRPGTVTRVRGRAEYGTPTVFQIIANVQPVAGKELEIVPEGDRNRQRLDVYTRTEIRINDQMTRDGNKYRTELVEKWGPYYMARVALEDVKRV